MTGGTRGIGRGIAEAFLRAGARVVVGYRGNDAAAEEFRQANNTHADRFAIHRFDVSQYAEVERFYRDYEQAGGEFDTLVNCSGIRIDSIVGMMKDQDWQRVIDTNLGGTFNMCKFAVRHLMRRRFGRIVNITSPVGRIGFPGQANYAASKAGQVAFTLSLAKEVAGRGITVNCVSPGFIDTDFIADLPEEQRKHYLSLVPVGRFGVAEEVATAVLYLAARESGYVTGAVLEVTGGI